MYICFKPRFNLQPDKYHSKESEILQSFRRQFLNYRAYWICEFSLIFNSTGTLVELKKNQELIASNNLLTKVRLPFMAAHTEDDDSDDDDEKEGPAHSDTSHGLGCQQTGACPVPTMVKSRASQVLIDASLVVTCVLVRSTGP